MANPLTPDELAEVRACLPLLRALRQLAEVLTPHPGAGGAVADPERWLDLRDDGFPVNPRLVWAAAKRGEIAVSRVGNATLVKARELDRWLQLQRFKPDSKAGREPARQADEPPSGIAHLVHGRRGR